MVKSHFKVQGDLIKSQSVKAYDTFENAHVQVASQNLEPTSRIEAEMNLLKVLLASPPLVISRGPKSDNDCSIKMVIIIIK